MAGCGPRARPLGTKGGRASEGEVEVRSGENGTVKTTLCNCSYDLVAIFVEAIIYQLEDDDNRPEGKYMQVKRIATRPTYQSIRQAVRERRR